MMPKRRAVSRKAGPASRQAENVKVYKSQRTVNNIIKGIN
jgi:hypothetical protein